MTNAEALQAQLKALEEELARKKLEEEIRRLESQLTEVDKTAAKASGTDGNIEDETEYEEEIIEEYVTDSEHEETAAPVSPKRAPPRQWPPPKTTNKNEVKGKAKPLVPIVKTSTCDNTGSGGSSVDDAPVKPRAKWVPMSQRKKTESQNDAATTNASGKESGKVVHAAPTAPASPAKAKLPEIPYTKRTVPKVPVSPEGQETAFESLLGPKLVIDASGKKMTKVTTTGAMQGRKFVLLLFGAKWQVECRNFYPKASDFFKLMAKKHDMECVYISSDRSLMEFKDLFASMPYLALPTGTAEIKNNLTQMLQIVELPVLVVLTGEGQVVTTRGFEEVSACERRNEAQYDSLVQKWKNTKTFPIEEIPEEWKLLNDGKIKRGTMAWISHE